MGRGGPGYLNTSVRRCGTLMPGRAPLTLSECAGCVSPALLSNGTDARVSGFLFNSASLCVLSASALKSPSFSTQRRRGRGGSQRVCALD